ncbi:DUF333 domain-containing protein [Vibrio sp. 1636]|nr:MULTISPECIES: DUF333 domain-containing protein [Vibrio]MDW2203849.1 DUF333 domain-containing protein [Vibrio sp. 1636]MDW2302806.1 DUF333 domain-containing protein [Vibrio sp. 1167]
MKSYLIRAVSVKYILLGRVCLYSNKAEVNKLMNRIIKNKAAWLDSLKNITALCFFLFISACSNTALEHAESLGALANPASTHCSLIGGKSAIEKADQGDRGYCNLPGGSTFDEWLLYRLNHQVLYTLQQDDAGIKIEHYQSKAIDFNGDSCPDFLILMNYESGYCGNAGCSLVALLCEDETLRFISNTPIVNEPIYLSKLTSFGMRDIIVRKSGGGYPSSDARLKFDGVKYPENDSRDSATILTSDKELVFGLGQ